MFSFEEATNNFGKIPKNKVHKDWINIHPDFDGDTYSSKSNQDYWEECNLTIQDAKDFIGLGFGVKDHREISEWKKNNFTYSEIKEFLSTGLNKKDYNFAYYLKRDNYQLNEINKDNLDEIRKKCSWEDIHPQFSFFYRK